MAETIIATTIGAAISIVTTVLTLLVNANVEKIEFYQRRNKKGKKIRGRN